MKLLKNTIILMIVLSFCYCKHRNVNVENKSANIADSVNVDSAQMERDYFYTLMSYAVVFKDWQTKSSGDKSRGYNIGSVLVNKTNYVVNWARNSVNVEKDKTLLK